MRTVPLRFSFFSSRVRFFAINTSIFLMRLSFSYLGERLRF